MTEDLAGVGIATSLGLASEIGRTPPGPSAPGVGSSKTNIPWQRYWAPREGTISLGDGGFLADPNGKYGRSMNPHLVSLEDVDDRQCLIFLGEPGIGKSTVVQDHYTRTTQAHPQKTIIYCDLRAYGSEDRIIRNVFERPEFDAWRRGSGPLDLYFDSLDECTVRISNIAALLAEQLRAMPCERLRLRVACRTAEWPALLEGELTLRFPEGHVKVLELAPLRRTDVEVAAERSGIAPGPFIQKLHEAAAVPLAIKPITLDFLLKIWTREGTLPSTQVELYEQGCNVLCQEQNESRLAAGHTGKLSAAKRMDIASWIAAATTFGGKSVIRVAPSRDTISSDELALTGLAFDVDEPSIRDVLAGSGLFTSRGAGRLGWAHKTYSDFLAARFVARRDMSLRQIEDLVLHPTDRDAIVPQLRETASWIASMRPDVFAGVAHRDPQVLLASDVLKADPSNREALLGHLLLAFDREQALDDDWGERAHYWKLTHLNLSGQLRPFISTKTKNVIARRVAIDIAEACECRDLQEELLAVAFDSTDNEHVRQQAAQAIATMGDATAQLRLRPLLTSTVEEDPQDELRGIAFRVLYPRVLSTAELFANLATERDHRLYGSYAAFLYGLAKNLKRHELPEALRWSLTIYTKSREYGPIASLLEAILQDAWKHAQEEDVASSLVALVEIHLKDHENPFGRGDEGRDWRPPAEARRAVARALLRRLEPENTTLLTSGQGPLLDQTDFAWLLDEFESQPTRPASSAVARLVARLAWHEEDGNLLSRSIELAFAHDGLRTEMTPMLGAIDLESPAVAEMREYHRLVSTRRVREERAGVQDAAAYVARLVEKCERDDIGWWWDVTRALELNDGDTRHQSPFSSQITKLPGWLAATEPTRRRLVALARRYVVEGDPANEAWFDTGTEYQNSALSGYRALQLLYDIDREWLSSLNDETLRKWVPIVASHPTPRSDELTRLLWKKCATALLDSVIARIELQRAADGADAGRVLDACWSSDIASAMLRLATETPSAGIRNGLIEQGIEHGDERFAMLAARVVRTPLPADATAPSKDGRIRLWSILIRRALALAWEGLWEVMRSEPEFAREAWLAVAYTIHRDVATLLQPLNPDQLADLLLWLATVFDLQPRGPRRGGLVGPVESMSDFREAVLGHLKQRGDWSSLAAIDRIAREMPDFPFIRLHRILARRAATQGTWQPLSPAQLASLAADQDTRVVESEEQLLAIVLESLARLAAALHDELSAIRDLWDKTESGWRPVEEADLSNRIARHLRDDLEARGIVVNREVKIRRGVPGKEGEQTDIYVDAFARSDAGTRHERLSVIVEVKGCWHNEVRTAMQTQLVDRYLHDNACDHGLYIVGWFIDDGWDPTDSRRRAAERMLPDGPDATTKLFDDQATALSRDGKLIRAFLLDARLRCG